jgi:hypothetical protein
VQPEPQRYRSLASTSVAVTLATNVGYVATAAGLLHMVYDQSTKNLQDKGYVEIPPGGRHRFGKESLSLWRQGHCVRTRRFDERMEIVTDAVFMRPIFTGATDDSNVDHTIQFWIDKFGFEDLNTITIPPPDDAGGSWGDVNLPLPEGGPVVSVTPTTAVAVTEAPAEAFFCDACGNGQPLINLNTRVFIPGQGFLTCGAVAQAVQSSEITVDVCPLLAQYITPCGCPAPFNPDVITPLLVPVDVAEVIATQIVVFEAHIDAQTVALEMQLGFLEEKLDDLTLLVLDSLKSKKKKGAKKDILKLGGRLTPNEIFGVP